MLLFKNMLLSCKSSSDGVSTWAKFDGHIFHKYVSCYMQKYLPFIMVMGVYRCCLQVKYIVYKYFDRLLHIWSSDPM